MSPAHPVQPLIDDPHGVRRFKLNAIVQRLMEFARQRGCGMNELAEMQFSDEDRVQFAQLIGYSLQGFGELSYVSDETYQRAVNGEQATDPCRDGCVVEKAVREFTGGAGTEE